MRNMNKTIMVVGVVVIVALVAWFFMGQEDSDPTDNNMSGDTSMEDVDDMDSDSEDRQAVTAGTYSVDAESSEFNWAGKKPLIDGYINSGTIAVTEGEIVVGENTASGSFTLDMDTLSVGLTATKPGSEGTLEQHLKGERWFNVSAYPTAEFTITNVTPTANSETTFEYMVTGDLTMKGVTNEISFPATIYQTADGLVHAKAKTEIDRTKWGITSGSGNFFESLGDNVIDDMVAISFAVVASAE